ncbi:hypothetical protein BGZ49_007931 [Haplosporangium sp. Z 27]|nr:hypothetical protein BGZ49_007931 [Haplosporangium sp. Z 27]
MKLGAGYERPKLITGTELFDGLVTSSTPVDSYCQDDKRHSVGLGNDSFVLKSDSDCQATRIFLDKKCVEKAFKLANDKKAFREMCANHTPSFTLYQNDSVSRGSGHEVGRLFDEIAISILEKGKDATISRKEIQGRLKGCKANSAAVKVLEKILLHFDERNLQEEAILENIVLNQLLEELATTMSSYISTANASVMKHLAKRIHVSSLVTNRDEI